MAYVPNTLLFSYCSSYFLSVLSKSISHLYSDNELPCLSLLTGLYCISQCDSFCDAMINEFWVLNGWGSCWVPTWHSPLFMMAFTWSVMRPVLETSGVQYLTRSMGMGKSLSHSLSHDLTTVPNGLQDQFEGQKTDNNGKLNNERYKTKDIRRKWYNEPMDTMGKERKGFLVLSLAVSWQDVSLYSCGCYDL